MRKLVVLEARPGMVLHAPVIDRDAEPVLASGHVLTEADLDVLSASGATEIEIADGFAQPSRELFPAHVEAAALQALNTIVLLHPGPDEPLRQQPLEKLITAIDELIAGAGPEMDGEADFAGPDTLQGHDYVHPVKVAELAIVLARAVRMEPGQVRELALAAALMNIGYAALRRSLLDEPRALEEHEWQHQITLHPESSRAILASSGLSAAALDAIEQHHERWNGSGYPHGLKEREIGQFARIIAIADTYISLRSRRAYRNPGSHADAIRLLKDGADELFDPDLVRLFVEITGRLIHEQKRAGSRATDFTSSEAPVEHAASRRAQETAASPTEVVARDRERDTQRSEETAATSSSAPMLSRRRPAPDARSSPRAVTPTGIRELRMPAPVAARPVRNRRTPRRRRSLWSSALYLESARRGGWTRITSN